MGWFAPLVAKSRNADREGEACGSGEVEREGGREGGKEGSRGRERCERGTSTRVMVMGAKLRKTEIMGTARCLIALVDE